MSNEKQNDPVYHPGHYTQGGIECIDAIKAALGKERFAGYCAGNVIKYIWRYRLKDGIEDLQKAANYLKMLEETEVKLSEELKKTIDEVGDLVFVHEIHAKGDFIDAETKQPPLRSPIMIKRGDTLITPEPVVVYNIDYDDVLKKRLWYCPADKEKGGFNHIELSCCSWCLLSDYDGTAGYEERRVTPEERSTP
jgi:hypothetical protein